MEGLDAGKNFTRRYDTKQDYVTTGGTFPSCQRSYLPANACLCHKYRRAPSSRAPAH